MQALFENHALPKNWKIEKFGQRIKLNYGKSQSGVQTPEGSIPIYGTGGFMGMADQWLSPGDSVLIGRKGTLNNPVYISEPFWAVDTTFYASDFDGSYKWLYYFVNFIDLSRWNEATGVPSLSRTAIHNIEIPFPPVDEQSKIAEVLSTIDRAIAQTEALIAKHQRIKTGLMQDLLTRGIDEHGQLRDESTHKFKSTPLGMIPVEWEVKELQGCTKSTITYGIVQAGPHIPGGIPYIRTGDMMGDALSKENLLCTSSDIASSFKRSEVRAGEIVISIRASVGQVLLVPDELDGANLTQGTARISPKENIHNEFLLWAIRSNRTQIEIDRSTKGTTFKEISLATLRKIPVAIPSSTDEQKLIANVLEKQTNELKSQNIALEKLRQIKTGLMQDLLSGEVSVTPLLEVISE